MERLMNSPEGRRSHIWLGGGRGLNRPLAEAVVWGVPVVLHHHRQRYDPLQRTFLCCGRQYSKSPFLCQHKTVSPSETNSWELVRSMASQTWTEPSQTTPVALPVSPLVTQPDHNDTDGHDGGTQDTSECMESLESKESDNTFMSSPSRTLSSVDLPEAAAPGPGAPVTDRGGVTMQRHRGPAGVPVAAPPSSSSSNTSLSLPECQAAAPSSDNDAPLNSVDVSPSPPSATASIVLPDPPLTSCNGPSEDVTRIPPPPVDDDVSYHPGTRSPPYVDPTTATQTVKDPTPAAPAAAAATVQESPDVAPTASVPEAPQSTPEPPAHHANAAAADDHENPLATALSAAAAAADVAGKTEPHAISATIQPAPQGALDTCVDTMAADTTRACHAALPRSPSSSVAGPCVVAARAVAMDGQRQSTLSPPSLMSVRCLLETVLTRFPPQTELSSRAFQSPGVDLRYVLETVNNWGLNGIVMKGHVVAVISVDSEGRPVIGETVRRDKKSRLEVLRRPQVHVLRPRGDISQTAAGRVVSSKSYMGPPAISPSTAAQITGGPLAKLRRFFGLPDVSPVPRPLSAVVDSAAPPTRRSRPPEPTAAAAVGRVRRLPCGIDVAVKIIAVDMATSDRDDLTRVMEEATLLSQLEHPFLPIYHESFSVPPAFCVIVQEYLIGSVRRLYRDLGPLPEWVIAFIVKDVLSALKYLHQDFHPAVSCIHRDIKASNILLDSDARAKLVDFGVAAMVPRGHMATPGLGTPMWMAPEAADTASSRGVGTPADIWSLGLTVIEMATGTLPLTATSRHTGANEHMASDSTSGANFEPTLEDGLYPGGTVCGTSKAAATTNRTAASSTSTERDRPVALETSSATHATSASTVHAAGTTMATVKVPLQFSPQIKDFVSLCVKRDPAARVTAEALLQHPFIAGDIRRAKSYRELFIELHKTAMQRKRDTVRTSVVVEETIVAPPLPGTSGASPKAAPVGTSGADVPPPAPILPPHPEQETHGDTPVPNLSSLSLSQDEPSRPMGRSFVESITRLWRREQYQPPIAQEEEACSTLREECAADGTATGRCVLDLASAGLEKEQLAAAARRPSNDLSEANIQLNYASTPRAQVLQEDDAKGELAIAWEIFESRVRSDEEDPLKTVAHEA